MLKIKDLDQLILSKLSDDDLFKFIFAGKYNKYLNRICQDENFWYKKICKKSDWKLEYPCKKRYHESYLVDIILKIFCNNDKMINIVNTRNVKFIEDFEEFPVEFLLKKEVFDKEYSIDKHDLYMTKLNLKILSSNDFKIVIDDLSKLCAAEIKSFISGEFFQFANVLLERKDYRKKKLLIITTSDPYKSFFHYDKAMNSRCNFYFC